jgi:hypothetical protein
MYDLDEEYKKKNSNIPEDVMKKVDEALEEQFKDYPKGMGFCHIYWNYKRQMLEEMGYHWQSPQDVADELDGEHGRTIFD